MKAAAQGREPLGRRVTMGSSRGGYRGAAAMSRLVSLDSLVDKVHLCRPLCLFGRARMHVAIDASPCFPLLLFFFVLCFWFFFFLFFVLCMVLFHGASCPHWSF